MCATSFRGYLELLISLIASYFSGVSGTPGLTMTANDLFFNKNCVAHGINVFQMEAVRDNAENVIESRSKLSPDDHHGFNFYKTLYHIFSHQRWAPTHRCGTKNNVVVHTHWFRTGRITSAPVHR